jgi:DNA-binding ferritin-like protein
MTPEERFERIERTLDSIAERHNALAQTVEILAGMQRENETMQRENEKRFNQVTQNFEIVLDSIRRLENIAAAH